MHVLNLSSSRLLGGDDEFLKPPLTTSTIPDDTLYEAWIWFPILILQLELIQIKEKSLLELINDTESYYAVTIDKGQESAVIISDLIRLEREGGPLIHRAQSVVERRFSLWCHEGEMDCGK